MFFFLNDFLFARLFVAFACWRLRSIFFAVRKNLRRQAWAHFVRMGEVHLEQKMAVAPATFFDQMGKSIF